MDITLHFGLSGLVALKESWQQIEAAIENPTHSHSFIWWHAYIEELAEQPDAFCFVCVREGDVPVAICQFVSSVKSHLGLFRTKILSTVHDPNFLFPDIMVRPDYHRPDFLQEVFRLLSRKTNWDKLVIGGVMGVIDSSHAVACLPSQPQGNLFLEEDIGCFTVQTDDFDALQQRLSRKDRANLRRTTKKFYAYEDSAHQSIEDEDDIEAALLTFLDVEAAGWKGAGGEGTAIKVNADMKRFYEKIAQEYGKRNQCQVNLLSVEGNVIAGQFAFQLGNTVFMNKIGFDPDYSPLNPGNVLMGLQFKRYCDESAIAQVNLMSSANHLKKWAPEFESSYRFYYFNSTLMGRAMALLFKLKPVVRKFIMRFREKGERSDKVA